MVRTRSLGRYLILLVVLAAQVAGADQYFDSDAHMRFRGGIGCKPLAQSCIDAPPPVGAVVTNQGGMMTGDNGFTFDAAHNYAQLWRPGATGSAAHQTTQCDPGANSCRGVELVCNTSGNGDIGPSDDGKQIVYCNGVSGRLRRVDPTGTPHDIGADQINHNGTMVGVEPTIDFIDGQNVTMTVVDDSAGQVVHITINSAGSGTQSCASLVTRASDVTQASVTDADLSAASLPALGAVGRLYRFASAGVMGLDTTHTANLKINVAGTTVCNTAIPVISGGLTARSWGWNGSMTVRATGSSGSIQCDSALTFDNPTAVTGLESVYRDHRTTTVNLTGTPSFATHITFGSSSATNTITESQIFLEQCDAGSVNTTTTTTTTATTTTSTTTTTTLLELVVPDPFVSVQGVSAGSANQLTCVRFVARESGSFTRLAFNVTTGAPGITCGIGIYPDSDSGVALIANEASCAAAGVISVSSSAFSLVKGTFYRLCECPTGSGPSILGIVNPINGTGGVADLVNAFRTTVGTHINSCNSGVMPSTTGALTANNSARPFIAVLAP